jgi:hypothetical protein
MIGLLLFCCTAGESSAQELQLSVEAAKSTCRLGEAIDVTWELVNISDAELLVSQKPATQRYVDGNGVVTDWGEQKERPPTFRLRSGETLRGSLKTPAMGDVGANSGRFTLGFQVGAGGALRTLRSNSLDFDVTVPVIPTTAKMLTKIPHISQLEIVDPTAIRLSSQDLLLDHLTVTGSLNFNSHFIDAETGKMKPDPDARDPKVVVLHRFESVSMSTRRHSYWFKFLGIRDGLVYLDSDAGVVSVRPYGEIGDGSADSGLSARVRPPYSYDRPSIKP